MLIVVYVIQIELCADGQLSYLLFSSMKPFAKVSPTRIKRYATPAIFPGEEVARIKAYSKKEDTCPMTPLIHLLAGILTLATAGSRLDSTSSPRAALAGRTTARSWSQVVREIIKKSSCRDSKKNRQGMWDLTRLQPPHWPMITPSSLKVLSSLLC